MLDAKSRVFVLLAAILATLPAPAQDNRTTWFVVRHADRDGDQDALTRAGQERAKLLADLMSTFRVQAVYSTGYQRTLDTAQPAARALNTRARVYDKLDPGWFRQLKTDHAGESVLIVGHSNTVGQIVRGLGGPGKYPIAHDEYDSLFIVTTQGSNCDVVRIRFGAGPGANRTPPPLSQEK